MNGRGYYQFPESAKLRVEAGELLVCWFTTGLFLAFLAFLLKIGADYSRGAFVAFYFLAPAGLLGVRKIPKVALTAAVSRGAIGYRNTVQIGDFNEIANLERQAFHFLGRADQVNRFELSREDDPSIRSTSDIRILDSVANFVRNNNCREILLALPWSDANRIEFVRHRIKALPVAARLLPDMRVRSLTSLSSSTRQHEIIIEVQRALLSGAQRLLKRLTDIVVSAMALVFLLPSMVLTAIAIKVDSPGPVIFRQNRKGFNLPGPPAHFIRA
jgi:hypothetical protein